MSNDEGIRGGTRGDYSPDAIGEFEVLSSQYDAQYGQASGAIINVLTRSGTNDLHARLSGYYRPNALAASDAFAQTNPDTHEKEQTTFNQWIASAFLGGPIAKDKLFYFGSFEQTWRDATAVVAVNPATLAALGLPAETSVPQDLREPRAVLKLDFHPTDSQTLTFRFRVDNPKTTNSDVGLDAGGGAIVTSQAGSTVDTQNYDYGLQHSWIISPVALNEARFQYSDQSNDFIPNCPGCAGIQRPSLFSGKLPNQPQTAKEKRYEFLDSVSLTLGANGEHSIKAGVDYNHIGVDAYVPQYFDGFFQFISNDPYNPDDPLTHPVVYIHGSGNPFINLSNNIVALFVQDQWQVLRNLTLNVGLRWDYEDQVYTKHDWQNFAPRVHFAWDPTCQGKTSIRGGFGMYYDQVMMNAPLIASAFEPGRFTIQATLAPGYPDPGTALVRSRCRRTSRCSTPTTRPRTRTSGASASSRSWRPTSPRASTWSTRAAITSSTFATPTSPSSSTACPPCPIRTSASPTTPRRRASPSTTRRRSGFRSASARTSESSSRTRWPRSKDNTDGHQYFISDAYSPDKDYGPSSNDIRNTLNVGADWRGPFGLMLRRDRELHVGPALQRHFGPEPLQPQRPAAGGRTQFEARRGPLDGQPARGRADPDRSDESAADRRGLQPVQPRQPDGLRRQPHGAELRTADADRRRGVRAAPDPVRPEAGSVDFTERARPRASGRWESMRKRSEGIFARAGGAPLAAVLALLAPAFAGAAPPAPAPASSAPPPAAASSSTPAMTAGDVEAFLDGLVPAQLGPADIGGAVVVVVKDGKILFGKGYGFADVEKRVPVDWKTTLFRPGSISKLFTWTAVMQLVEQGKLDLDKDVNTYLDFKVPEAFGKPITLRDIMTHTSGYEDYAKDLIVGDPKMLVPLGDHLKTHQPQRIFPPGSTPAYSNYATAVAGYIVERVSGKPFANYVEEFILGPLGMKQASFQQPLPAALEPDMSKGYKIASEKAKPFEIVVPAPAGALSASGDAMARFMLAHLQDGSYEGARILSPETAKLMHARQRGKSDQTDGMALGFYEESRNGHRIIGHGGDTNWFHSDLHLIPDANVGFFVSYNSGGNGKGSGRTLLWEQFLDRYFPWTPPAAPRVADAKEQARKVAGNYLVSRRSDSKFLRLLYLLEQTKVYPSPTDEGAVEISALTGYNGKPKSFEPIGNGVFRVVHGQEKVVFQKDPLGREELVTEYPFFDFFRPPAYLDAKLVLPVAIVSLCFVVLALILWPVGGARSPALRPAARSAARGAAASPLDSPGVPGSGDDDRRVRDPHRHGPRGPEPADPEERSLAAPVPGPRGAGAHRNPGGARQRRPRVGQPRPRCLEQTRRDADRAVLPRHELADPGRQPAPRRAHVLMRKLGARAAVLAAVLFAAVALRAGEAPFDVVIRGGTVYDGTGDPGRAADVGIRGDKVAAVGDLSKAAAARVVDAKGMAVAPGFVNMLSWSTESLIVDGRSQSELRQGITTQIFGEGFSMGPLNEGLRKFLESQQTDFHYEMPWTTLAEYLAYLEKRGISQNVASYIGRDDAPGVHRRLRQARADPEGARRDARARPPGDGGRRPRHRVRADLCPRQLRDDRGADRALQGRGEVPGQVHLAHAQRGGRTAGGGGRAHPDQPRGRSARRDLPPEGRGRGQLAEDGQGHRAGRRGAPPGIESLGEHVPVHRGRNEPRRVRAALGARRRQRRDDRPPQGPGDAGKNRGRDAPSRAMAGRTSAS